MSILFILNVYIVINCGWQTMSKPRSLEQWQSFIYHICHLIEWFFWWFWRGPLIQLLDQPAAAKSLHLCLTLCDPIDGSPPGSPVPGILQARTLEWAASSFSSAWMWKVKVKSLSHIWLLVTPWTAAYQAPLSMGFSRQEYGSGTPEMNGPLSLRGLFSSRRLEWTCSRDGSSFKKENPALKCLPTLSLLYISWCPIGQSKSRDKDQGPHGRGLHGVWEPDGLIHWEPFMNNPPHCLFWGTFIVQWHSACHCPFSYNHFAWNFT